MQITNSQKIALWELLAETLKLEHVGNNSFVGDCPYCKMPDSYVVKINLNYAGCLFCSQGNGSLVSNIKRLMNSTSSGGMAGLPC